MTGDEVRTLLGLSGFAIALPLLVAWTKLRIWELHRRYGYGR